MRERSEMARRAMELLDRVAEVRDRIEAGDEVSPELDAELQRLEAELADLEAEERRLDEEFDTGESRTQPPREDADGSGPAASVEGEETSSADAGHRATDLGSLVDRLVDTVTEVVKDIDIEVGSLGITGFGGRCTSEATYHVDVAGPVAVVVRSPAGPVSVVPGSDDGVQVHAVRVGANEDVLASMEVRVDAVADGVEVVAEWPDRIRRAHVRLRVEVPAGSPVTVDTRGGSVRVSDVGGPAVARTKGGSIRVSGAAGDVSAETAGGSIRVTEHDGPVSARTLGGSVRLSGRLTGSVVASTKGGSIRVEGLEQATVEATTSGGSIRAQGRPIGASALKTAGGSIALRLDRDSRVTVTGKGSSARADVPGLHVVRNRIEGAVGDGTDGSIDLRTSGGAVRVALG